MPAIIEVINPSGTSILDVNRFNPCMAQKGTAVTVADSPKQYESVASRADITFAGGTGMEFMLALRPHATIGFTAPMGYNASGTDWTVRLVSGSAPGTAVDWWVFARPTAASSSGVVVEIRDENQQLVYSLQQRPLKVPPGGALQNAGLDADIYVGSPGRTYAAVFLSYVGGWFWRDGAINPNTSQPETGWYAQAGAVLGAKAITNGISLGEMVHSDASTSIGTLTQGDPILYPGTFLIADVTGY